MVADFAIVTNFPIKISLHKFLNITTASTQNLDTLSLKHILCSLPHIACKHDLYPHHLEYRSYSALASTAFRRSHLAHAGNLIVNDIKNSIICAMAEMIIHASVSCWNSYLH